MHIIIDCMAAQCNHGAQRWNTLTATDDV